MTQRDIDRAVARATGETVGRVHQMGFTLIVIPPPPVSSRQPAGNHRANAKPLNNNGPLATRAAAQA